MSAEKKELLRTRRIVLRFLLSMLDLYELDIVRDKGKFKIRDLQFEESYISHYSDMTGADSEYYNTLSDVLHRLGSDGFLYNYIERAIEDHEVLGEKAPTWDYYVVEFTNSPIIAEILHDISPSEYVKITRNDDSTDRMINFWRMNYTKEIEPILFPKGVPNYEH